MSTRNDKDKDKGVNVQVLLRCRPPSEDELRANAPQVISCQEHRREVTVYQNIASKQIDRTFTFDKVFGPTSQQRDLYDQAISPIVYEVLEGFNCTIFAYGQTGTGKTYTMEGAGRKAKSGELPIDAGVIPRAIQQIFDTLESQNAEYSVKVTFLELYNEEITDLLAPEEIVKVIDDKQKKPLALMEDGKGGVLVRGLEEEIVATANEIYSLLDRGSAKRRTAETLLNKQSSRSHSIFSITIHIKEATPEGEELIKCGKLNLVDLAGSENISRSGAREGRAREAGEINKSLLTLGRVITALVEHLGHIPYRDSKLTRLLRDSLGGRTKTCIIATVSPSVHCLEETLSTLDYAHRAKNIRNKPEVNQKMMKSALIKDLYGEIEKLKSEVYAAREKNGIYVPRERYYQDEAEKKAMAEKIEQMECDLEAKDKQIEDVQELSDSQRQQISDLKYKLDNTQKILEQTEEALLDAKDDAKQAHYSVKEREFVILHQQQAENSLVEQACQLRSQLEAAAQDIKGLFEKIEHKENIETENQKVVQKYQCELSQQLLALDSTVNNFVVDQQKQIQSMGIKLQNFNVSKEKGIEELKERILCLKAVCASQFEIIQAVTVDHESKASTAAKNMNDMINGHAGDLNNLLLSAASEAEGLLTGLQSVMAEQQSELAAFAQQQREAAFKSREAAGLILTVMKDFFVSLDGNISELGQYMDASQRTRDQSLADLHQAYEDRTRQDENDLLTGIANLLAGTMHQTREVIAARVKNLRDSSIEESKVLQQGMTKAHEVTCKAQERLHAFNDEAEANALEASAFLAAKHCRMEELLQHCVKNTATSADQWRTTVASLQKLEGEHVPSVVALIRQLEDENALHTMQLKEVEVSAQSEIVSKHEFIVDFIENTCTAEKEEVNSMQSSMTSYSLDVGNLEACHKSNLEEVHKQTGFYLKDKYLVEQPTANTPTKRAIDIPNRSLIEDLRAPGLEVLLEEYREKNSPLVLRRGIKHENGLVKEAKSFAASDFLSKRETRIPLMTVNRLER